MKNTRSRNSQAKSKVLSYIILIAMLVSIASCASPRCGYMKHYNRDVRMGIAH